MQEPSNPPFKTLPEFNNNGKNALRALLVQSEYGSLEQAVASLVLFSHLDTVEQVKGENVFLVIRGENSQRGHFEPYKAMRVMLDDNLSASNAFKWANNFKHGRKADLQFNHVFSASQEVLLFTNLINICVLPAFLSKLSDTDDKVKALLQYHAFQLYGKYWPSWLPKPPKPMDYDALIWAPTLPAVQNVEAAIRGEMRTKQLSRTVKSVLALGWHFSKGTDGGYHPAVI